MINHCFGLGLPLFIIANHCNSRLNFLCTSNSVLIMICHDWQSLAKYSSAGKNVTNMSSHRFNKVLTVCLASHTSFEHE